MHKAQLMPFHDRTEIMKEVNHPCVISKGLLLLQALCKPFPDRQLPCRQQNLARCHLYHADMTEMHFQLYHQTLTCIFHQIHLRDIV